MVYIKEKTKRRITLKMRGMMTVEASFLIPMVVMAAGIMISLGIFVYQR